MKRRDFLSLLGAWTVAPIAGCSQRRKPLAGSEESDVIDWRRTQELLFKESKPLVRALFSENKKRKDVVGAIGYVFYFGGDPPYFDLCANTARNAKTALAEFLAEWPDASADDFRWNSGDYDYPGGVADRFAGGYSKSWWRELERINRLAEDNKHRKHVHDRVADVCCNVLAELARQGLLGDWSVLDFNVSMLDDETPLIKRRHKRIRKLIMSSAEPKGKS